MTNIIKFGIIDIEYPLVEKTTYPYINKHIDNGWYERKVLQKYKFKGSIRRIDVIFDEEACIKNLPINTLFTEFVGGEQIMIKKFGVKYLLGNILLINSILEYDDDCEENWKSTDMISLKSLLKIIK